MANPATQRPLPRAIPGPSAIMWGFPLRAKALFFRQLATMVNSAVSISQSVRTAGTVTFPSLTKEMANYVDQAYPLSQVMERYPHYFSDYEVAAVRTGEMGGNLDGQLDTLAVELEKTYNLKQNLTSKLFYPALVGHAAVFIPPLVIIVTKGLGAYIAITLGILIPIYLLAGIFYFLYRMGSQSGAFRSAIDTLLFYTPVVGGAVRLMALTRFLRCLGHLHEAGMLPDQALDISSHTCGNAHIANLVIASARRNQDTPTSKILSLTGVFPKIVSSLLHTGEDTGQTGRMLYKAADLIEQDMQVQMHRIVTVLPICMLMGVGVLVGALVIHMFSGIMAQVPW